MTGYVAILGSSPAVLIGLTLLLFGLASWLMGKSLAEEWRGWRGLLLYCLLLALANRFLIYALFDAPLLHISGFAIHGLVILAVAAFSFRRSQTRRMISQYPWLYEAAGPLSWRVKPQSNREEPSA